MRLPFDSGMPLIEVRRLLVLLALAMLSLALDTPSRAAPPASKVEAPALSDQVVALVLKGNWDGLARQLGSRQDLAVHERFLLAHAQLALNRNNESFCGFTALVTAADALDGWEAWSRAFRDANTKSAVAHYLHGDALARLERWSDAHAAFDRGVELHPKGVVHAMLLDARGAVRFALGETAGAQQDLEEATTAAPTFADAYASRGAVLVNNRSTAVAAAEAHFAKALEQTPKFGLAHIGRAVARYGFGPKHWDAAEEDAKKGGELLGCGALAQAVLLGLEQARASWGVKQSRALLAQATPGTALYTNVEAARVESVKRQDQIATLRNEAKIWGDYGRQVVGFGVDVGLALTAPEVAVGRSLAKKVVWTAAVSERARQHISDALSGMSRDFSSRINELRLQTPSPGGVSTMPSWNDDGDWPVATVFGLLYPVLPPE